MVGDRGTLLEQAVEAAIDAADKVTADTELQIRKARLRALEYACKKYEEYEILKNAIKQPVKEKQETTKKEQAKEYWKHTLHIEFDEFKGPEPPDPLTPDMKIMAGYFKYELLLQFEAGKEDTSTPKATQSFIQQLYGKMMKAKQKLYTNYGDYEFENLLIARFKWPEQRVYKSSSNQVPDSSTAVKAIGPYVTYKRTNDNADPKEWWTVLEQIGNDEYREKLYHGSQDTYYSRILNVNEVPSKYTKANDTWIRWTQTVKRAKEDLNESLDFMRVFLVPWRWIAGLMSAKTVKYVRNVFAALTLVALFPISFPVWLVQQVYQYLPAPKWRDYEFSYSHLLSWALAVASLSVLAVHKGKIVYSIMCVTGVIFATGAAVNAYDISRDASVVLSIEILMETYSASTFAQVIITGACVAAAMILALFNFMIPTEYIAVWIAFRLLRITHSDVGAEGQWRICQVLLTLLVSAHMMRRFTGPSSTLTRVSARSETLMTVIVLLAVLSLYDQQGVLPWDIPLILMSFPFAYIASIALPRPVLLLNRSPRDLSALLLEFITGCAAIAALVLAFTYDRPTTVFTPATDPCNFALTNMHTCTGAADVYVGGTCCRNPLYTVVQSKHVFRTAIADECQPILYENTDTDCCGQTRTAQTDHLMAGKYACICNDSPVQETSNTLGEDGVCSCGAGYSGTACEYPV